MKKLKSAFCFLAVLGLGFGLYSFSAGTLSNKRSEVQSEWENLEVLPQDISKDSLMGLMKGFTKSLGVRCDYCHTPREDRPDKLNFADDGKETKLIARGMIKMTHAINEDYFKPYYPDPKPEKVNDVTCVICHRGNPNPKKYLEGIRSLYPEKKSKEEE